MTDLVFANITQRPTRTVTSVLGIAVAVVMIVVTAGLARGMLQNSGQRESNVGAELIFLPPGSFGPGVATTPLSLPVAYAPALRKVEGVRAVTPVARYVRSGADPSSTAIGFEWIEGVAEDATVSYASYADITGARIVRGRLPAADDEIIVDLRRADEPGHGLDSSLELLGRSFRVVGVFAPEVGSRIKMRLRTMQGLLGTSANCSWILVKLESPRDQEVVARRIAQRFPGNQVVFTRDIPAFYAQGIPTLNIFLDVVVGLATVISTLNILLSMHNAVTERTREIGILKSLGASRRFIVAVVEEEALLISVIGVAAGLAMAALATFAIVRSTSLFIHVEPRWVVIATTVALLGGFLGALYPASRAAGQDPVKALAYE